MVVTADHTATSEALEARVRELATDLKVPGVAVAILHGGDEHHAFHGVTSLENPLPVEEHTLFQIGSTTKTFTATAIMRLVDEGRVRLDERVRTYVPELQLQDEDAAASVTVLQILNHTGGWVGDFITDTGDGDDALARYVELMAGLKQVNPPGTIASYNNAAFTLAGRLIERVTGQVYEHVIKDSLLDPLRLRETYFFTADVMTRRFAVGHTYHEREGTVTVARPAQLPRSAAPAGGLWATAQDQIRYARFHMGHGSGDDGARVLSTESLALMQQPTFSLEGGALGDSVGISWLIRDVDGAKMVAHGGGTNGQISFLGMIPERSFAVAVLTNSSKGSELEQELVKWALHSYLGLEEKEPEVLQLDAATLREYAGSYLSDTSIADITVTDSGLRIELTYTEDGLKLYRAVSDEPPEVPAPFTINLIGSDRYTVLEGPLKGLNGNFVRSDDRVTGINLGGRLAVRQ